VALIMTVNPFAGARPQSSLAFNTRGTYEFVIDTNGHAVANFAYRFYFSAVRNGSQPYNKSKRPPRSSPLDPSAMRSANKYS